jgi:hypothetical protein
MATMTVVVLDEDGDGALRMALADEEQPVCALPTIVAHILSPLPDYGGPGAENPLSRAED